MNRLKLSLALLLSLIVTLPSLAQKAAKEAHPVGNLVIVAPEKVDEARQVWMLTHPETFEQYSIENGKLFLAMPKHSVRFRLLIVPNDVTKDIYFKAYDLSPAGSVPDPKPDDPPPVDPPPPQSQWQKWVWENRGSLPENKPLINALGDNFIAVSKANVADTVALTVMLREKNQETLKDNFMAYVNWSKALQTAMINANLSESVAASKTACFEIGTALKELAK